MASLELNELKTSTMWSIIQSVNSHFWKMESKQIMESESFQAIPESIQHWSNFEHKNPIEQHIYVACTELLQSEYWQLTGQIGK